MNEVIREENGDLRSIFGFFEYKPFQNLLKEKKLINPVKQILNDNLTLFQSRINIQNAFNGNGFFWHSDFETWHTEDGMPLPRALSAVVCLSDNNEYNGSLMVIPKSHKTFYPTQGPTPDNFWKKSLVKAMGYFPGVISNHAIEAEVEKHGMLYLKGKPGTVILFDCNILHSSHSNRSPWPRTNLFMVFNAKSNQLKDEPYGSQKTLRPEYLAYRNSEYAFNFD